MKSFSKISMVFLYSCLLLAPKLAGAEVNEICPVEPPPLVGPIEVQVSSPGCNRSAKRAALALARESQKVRRNGCKSVAGDFKVRSSAIGILAIGQPAYTQTCESGNTVIKYYWECDQIAALGF